MVYTPLTWVGSTYQADATPTSCCTSNLNHLETQYDEMVTYSTAYGGIASPVFTGLLYSSTPAQSVVSTAIATCAYVQTRVGQVHTDLHVTGLWTTAV